MKRTALIILALFAVTWLTMGPASANDKDKSYGNSLTPDPPVIQPTRAPAPEPVAPKPPAPKPVYTPPPAPVYTPPPVVEVTRDVKRPKLSASVKCVAGITVTNDGDGPGVVKVLGKTKQVPAHGSIFIEVPATLAGKTVKVTSGGQTFKAKVQKTCQTKNKPLEVPLNALADSACDCEEAAAGPGSDKFCLSLWQLILAALALIAATVVAMKALARRKADQVTDEDALPVDSDNS